MLVPDFQHDHLALIGRQLHQATLGGALLRRFAVATLEPAARFQFPRQPPPHPAPIIERAVAEAAQAIVRRLFRRLGLPQQRHERLLQHIFGFAVAQAQGPPVQDELGRLLLILALAPMTLLIDHKFTR